MVVHQFMSSDSKLIATKNTFNKIETGLKPVLFMVKIAQIYLFFKHTRKAIIPSTIFILIQKVFIHDNAFIICNNFIYLTQP